MFLFNVEDSHMLFICQTDKFEKNSVIMVMVVILVMVMIMEMVVIMVMVVMMLMIDFLLELTA